MEEEKLVTASAVIQQFGIPEGSLYYLIKRGLPHVDATKPWHQRKHYLFKLSEVAAFLANRPDDATT